MVEHVDILFSGDKKEEMEAGDSAKISSTKENALTPGERESARDEGKNQDQINPVDHPNDTVGISTTTSSPKQLLPLVPTPVISPPRGPTLLLDALLSPVNEERAQGTRESERERGGMSSSVASSVAAPAGGGCAVPTTTTAADQAGGETGHIGEGTGTMNEESRALASGLQGIAAAKRVDVDVETRPWTSSTERRVSTEGMGSMEETKSLASAVEGNGFVLEGVGPAEETDVASTVEIEQQCSAQEEATAFASEAKTSIEEGIRPTTGLKTQTLNNSNDDANAVAAVAETANGKKGRPRPSPIITKGLNQEPLPLSTVAGSLQPVNPLVVGNDPQGVNAHEKSSGGGSAGEVKSPEAAAQELTRGCFVAQSFSPSHVGLGEDKDKATRRAGDFFFRANSSKGAGVAPAEPDASGDTKDVPEGSSAINVWSSLSTRRRRSTAKLAARRGTAEEVRVDSTKEQPSLAVRPTALRSKIDFSVSSTPTISPLQPSPLHTPATCVL